LIFIFYKNINFIYILILINGKHNNYAILT